ncbi:MAG: 30S ribosome-binding factor RbfA [Peptococcaceae bacterium]|nr:30S ribosome-binding factor RbfA [Peptococcaceae bacterium]
MSHRPEKLAEAIKKEISDILFNDIKDPRMGFITVTAVTVTADLRYAKVYASVLGDEEKQKITEQALKSAAGYFRTELGKRIRLRYVPEINFELDTTLEKAAKLIKLIEEVQSSGDDGVNE